MAKNSGALIEVRCPCCEATLRIDPVLQAVISHTEHRKPAPIEDLQAAVKKMKGEESRRSEVFEKSFEDHKNQQKILARKFDELLKQAQEEPDSLKPKRPFDFD